MQRSYQFYVERRIGPGGANYMEVVLFPVEQHQTRVPSEMIRVRTSGIDGSSGHAVVDARRLLARAVLAEWLPSELPVAEREGRGSIDDK
jgi:hypothetical protein